MNVSFVNNSGVPCGLVSDPDVSGRYAVICIGENNNNILIGMAIAAAAAVITVVAVRYLQCRCHQKKVEVLDRPQAAPQKPKQEEGYDWQKMIQVAAAAASLVFTLVRIFQTIKK